MTQAVWQRPSAPFNSGQPPKPLLGPSVWKWKPLSRVRLFETPYSPWNSPGQNTGVGSLSLLQGIFPSQGSNPDLSRCRQILYQLSHKGSHKQGEKTTLRIGENNSKWNNWQRINFQSIQAAQTSQYHLKNNPVKKWEKDLNVRPETVKLLRGKQNTLWYKSRQDPLWPTS